MIIYNVIILDESGSMSSVYKETLQSMNEVLSGIRKDEAEHPDQEHSVTIVTFEGNGIKGIKLRRDRVPVCEVKDFTEEDYRPGGCTPLHDAMGKTLNDMTGLVQKEDRVMVTVITDGYENASEEYDGKAIKAMVSRLREAGWVFAYIGANQDAIQEAGRLNISNALNYEPTAEGMMRMSVRWKKAHNRMSKCIAGEMEEACLNMLFDDGDK